MKIVNNNQYELEVFFPNEAQANPEIPVPADKPYILFKADFQNEKDRDFLTDSCIYKLGVLYYGADYVAILVTGINKIIKAIELFSENKDYQLDKKLIEYKNKCKVEQLKKLYKQPPLKSKDINSFDLSSTNQFENSSNETFLLTKRSNPSKQYVLKKSFYDRTIYDFEVFNALNYRMLLGDRHPKVKGLHDHLGKRSGIASQLILNAISIKRFYEIYGPMTYDEILNSELIKILAAAYAEDESDLHIGNILLDKTGYAIKIDDDRSDWSETAKYFSFDPQVFYRFPKYETHPLLDFQVDEVDIINFPFLRSAKPANWIDRNDNQPAFEADAFKTLIQNKKFSDDKYYIFLKRILIPASAYKGTAKAAFRSEKKQAAAVKRKCSKTEELTSVLIKTPEFREFIVANPNAIKKIKCELQKFNNDYKKHNCLQVNLQEVDTQYKELQNMLKLSFLERHPIVRDMLIGAAIGIAITGLAFLALSIVGALLPAVGSIVFGFFAASIASTPISGGAVAAASSIAISTAATVGAGIRKRELSSTTKVSNNYGSIKELPNFEKNAKAKHSGTQSCLLVHSMLKNEKKPAHSLPVPTLKFGL